MTQLALMVEKILKSNRKWREKLGLTHWGRVTHTCVSKLTIIGSDNGLLPGRHQAIIWTNAGILLIRTLGTNFSEILSKILAFSFKKMHLKMSSGKWRPSCLGLNVLRPLLHQVWLNLAGDSLRPWMNRQIKQKSILYNMVVFNEMSLQDMGTLLSSLICFRSMLSASWCCPEMIFSKISFPNTPSLSATCNWREPSKQWKSWWACDFLRLLGQCSMDSKWDLLSLSINIEPISLMGFENRRLPTRVKCTS